jgi:hypothetical protein
VYSRARASGILKRSSHSWSSDFQIQQFNVIYQQHTLKGIVYPHLGSGSNMSSINIALLIQPTVVHPHPASP